MVWWGFEKPRSQRRDLGHPATAFVIPTLDAMRLRQGWGTQFCGWDKGGKNKGEPILGQGWGARLPLCLTRGDLHLNTYYFALFSPFLYTVWHGLSTRYALSA